MPVKLIKFLDKYFGSAIALVLGAFSGSKDRGKFEKILVVQLWGIGETILVLPSLRALREKYKKATISVVATQRNIDIFYNNKDANKILKLNLNPFSVLFFILKNFRKFDLVVDMEEYLNVSAIISFFAGKYRVGYSHNVRAKLYHEKVKYNDNQHAMETFLDLVRKVNADFKAEKLLSLNYSEQDKERVDGFLKNKADKNDFLIGIAPGAAESAKARMWPWKNYAQLCNNILSNKKNKIIFVGNQVENGLIQKIQSEIKVADRTINTAGFFDLNALFYLIKKCNLFVGNDSGPMHIAAAQGVKTVGLFGPNLPVRFGPYGKWNVAIYKGYNCSFSPCINVHKGQVPDCLFAENSEDYGKCMKNIKVGDVLKEIKN